MRQVKIVMSQVKIVMSWFVHLYRDNFFAKACELSPPTARQYYGTLLESDCSQFQWAA